VAAVLDEDYPEPAVEGVVRDEIRPQPVVDPGAAASDDHPGYGIHPLFGTQRLTPANERRSSSFGS
jgi:hypothetical protein